MHHLDLLLTLTGGLASALVLGYITHRIGLSPIVGYLLAGILIGGNTPGFVADREIAEQLAEVGVILLMFGVGLQFHVEELWAVRRIAAPGAIAWITIATLLGAVLGRSFGWGWTAGLVYGLSISVASTVVLVRVLADNHDLHTPSGHIAVGWLVVEDLVTVVVLVLLPAFFTQGDAAAHSVGFALGRAVLSIAVLVLVTLIVGGRVIPWLLTRVAATRSRELFTLTILVVALGIAVGSARLFGVSMALGAFLAGTVVGRSDFSLRAASEALPMRDAFAVLFFVSVGMLFDPHLLLESPGLVSLTLAIIIVGKPLAAFCITLFAGYPVRVALPVAIALGQIGEFSFILSGLGRSLGIFENQANAVIAAAIVSISLNPLLYRGIDGLERWLHQRPRLWRRLNARAQSPVAVARHALSDEDHHAVIVGYGPVGKTVLRLLRENEIEPTVIELNLDTVHRLRGEGISAVYGDATHVDTLKGAGVDRAGSLILSSSGHKGSEEVIRLARELNPDIRILARATYVHEIPALRRAGAEAVFSAEGEVALAVTEAIVRALGATPEQIDRERHRVHAELLGERPAVDLAASVLSRVLDDREDDPPADDSDTDADDATATTPV